MSKECVIILSGGLDSTTLLYDLVDSGRDVTALSFDYDQKHSRELSYATKSCKALGVSHNIYDLKVLSQVACSALTTSDINVPEGDYYEETMKSTVVPSRNLIMLSITLSYAQSQKIPEIYIGAHSGDHAIYPDCRPEFYAALQEVANVADYYHVDVKTPYISFSKGDIVKRGVDLNVDYSNTWTCYNGRDRPCGQCGACRERLEAFAENNITDPLEYEN